MVKFNKEDFMKLAIQNCEPQPHRRKWSIEEESIIHKCIEKGLSLEDISQIINLRSHSAIYTKANSLGYGYKRNNDDGLTYFHTEINHKNRRTKEEIMEGKEFVSVATEKEESQGTDIEVVSDIIPKKVEIAVADIDTMIEILKAARSGYEQHRTIIPTN